jgi:hypothetical protein
MMSARRRRLTKLCADCRDRKAKFCYCGRVKCDRAHVLCFRCWRAEMKRFRARQLAFAWHDSASSSTGWRPASAGPDDRQLAHRARMLEHLSIVAGGTSGRRR